MEDNQCSKYMEPPKSKSNISVYCPVCHGQLEPWFVGKDFHYTLGVECTCGYKETTEQG